MGDIELLKKFQAIDANRGKTKKSQLLQLKSRIETNMFLLKLDDTHSQPKIKAQNVIEEHLQVVIEAIYLYQHNKLTAEYMEKINHINRIYKL